MKISRRHTSIHSIYHNNTHPRSKTVQFQLVSLDSLLILDYVYVMIPFVWFLAWQSGFFDQKLLSGPGSGLFGFLTLGQVCQAFSPTKQYKTQYILITIHRYKTKFRKEQKQKKSIIKKLLSQSGYETNEQYRLQTSSSAKISITDRLIATVTARLFCI